MNDVATYSMLAIVVGACVTCVIIVSKGMVYFMDTIAKLATKEDINRLNTRLDLQFNSSVDLVERVARLEATMPPRHNGGRPP